MLIWSLACLQQEKRFTRTSDYKFQWITSYIQCGHQCTETSVDRLSFNSTNRFANSGSERYVCLYSVVWARIHGERKAGMVKSVVKLMEQQLSYVPQSIRDANEYIHNSWVCSALTVNICYREIRLLFVYERATAWVGRLTINFSSNSHSYLRAWNYCIADNVPNFVYWTR